MKTQVPELIVDLSCFGFDRLGSEYRKGDDVITFHQTYRDEEHFGAVVTTLFLNGLPVAYFTHDRGAGNSMPEDGEYSHCVLAYYGGQHDEVSATYARLMLLIGEFSQKDYDTVLADEGTLCLVECESDADGHQLEKFAFAVYDAMYEQDPSLGEPR